MGLCTGYSPLYLVILSLPSRMDLRRKLIRLAHQNPSLRPHILPLLKSAGDVIPFRPPVRNTHTITIAGTKYLLSDYWPDMMTGDDEPNTGGAQVIRLPSDSSPWKYLWVYDLDKQTLTMWRVTDGNEKEHRLARSAQALIVHLDKKGQLNRVPHNQYAVIERDMAHRADAHMKALEAWVEELKTDTQRDVDELVREYFAQSVRPVADKALAEVETGVIPFGFKLIPGGFGPERQMKAFVIGQVYDRLFNLDKIDAYVKAQGVDLDLVDPQATQWAQQDVWYEYAKSVLR